MEQENFSPNYQTIYFQESSNNSINTVISKRKCLAQIYAASSSLLDDEGITCDILDNRLKEINTLVDDQSIINNYASSIQALLPTNVDCSHWQNELKLSDFDELLDSLKCCLPDQPTNEDIKQLTKEKQQTPCEKSNFFETKQSSISTFNNDNSNISSDKQSSKRNNAGSFVTAAEFHKVQNSKKNSQPQQSSYNGPQKRSLGSRGRGINSKFVSPMRSDDNNSSQEEYSRNSSEEVDERLKNIEPRMVELIRSEIMDSSSPITWDDIAGLEFAKTIIKEVVVWPLLRPDIFTGLRRPPKGILLFGPPGTGKTLIGKCIASQSQSTFFSISASSLTSKWIGDGEKMVRALFAVAKCHQPAVIFIDEIDSLLTQRSETEHESSRRIKTEFLVQLDGATTGEEERILVIGATNRPQELDEAARRRFVKRLYIPLPEQSARKQIVERLINTERHELTEANINEVSELSDGYSGADMKNLCAEASLGPIRSIDISLIQNIQADQVRSITMDDFRAALNRVRASVSSADLDQYIVWDKTYGAGGW